MAKRNEKITAIYVRVSSANQNTRSQLPDLKRWVKSHTEDISNVRWYIDKASGKTMNRPEWNKLQSDIDNNLVSHLVVWRLDRLGRTASGLTKLFEELQTKKVHFESIKDKIDLNTTAGRLIANVLASVAAYETEIRAERVKAGQQAARAIGKTWGGSKKGNLYKTTIEQVHQIVAMNEAGEKKAVIARTVGIDRPAVYRILKRVQNGNIGL